MIQQPAINGLNNAVLRGVDAMPIKDSTSDGSSTFSLFRRRFLLTNSALPPRQNNQAQRVGISNRFTANFAAKTGPSQVTDNSNVVARRKAAAIGQSMNPTGGPLSFMSSSNRSVVNDAKVRARAGGAATVPKKVTQKYQFMATPPTTVTPPLKGLY